MVKGTKFSPDDRMAIEALLTEYGWRVDHGGRLGDLFTRDGVVTAPSVGIALLGRDAITAHFLTRHESSGQTTLHTWSGLRIEEITQATVRVRTIQSTFLRLPNEQPGVKHQMIGETRDVLRRDEAEWLFAERHLEVVFPFDVSLVPVK